MVEVAKSLQHAKSFGRNLIDLGGCGCIPTRTVSSSSTKFKVYQYTPPKLNMESENDGFQKESPFPGVDFQVPCSTSGAYICHLCAL